MCPTQDNTVNIPLGVDYLLEDWKECRNSIKELDKIIVDLRKYGFTIITGLISADAFLFIRVSGLSPQEKFVASFVTILLIYALFMIERYFSVLLSSAVRRAVNIEKKRAMNLSFQISTFAERAGTSIWALSTYQLFILASVFPILATSNLALFIFDPREIFFIFLLSVAALLIYVQMRKYYIQTKVDYEYEEQCKRNTEAIDFENSGREDDAIFLFEKNVKEKYINNYSYDRLTTIYRKRGMIRHEIRVLKTAKWVFENNINKYRSDRKQKLQRFKKRLRQAKKIQEHTNKGIASAKQKQYEEAINHYDKALDIDSGYVVALSNKGIALVELKEYKEALKCFNGAIRTYHKYRLAWIQKCATLKKLNMDGEAYHCKKMAKKYGIKL